MAASDSATLTMADGAGADSDNEKAVPLEFSLSDPDVLAQQLDRVDLTEEESDELLQEAYRVNKQLKMILQKQEKMGKTKSMRAQSAESSTSGYKVLPPIKRGGGGVPAEARKAYSHQKSASQASKPRTKSAKAKSSAPKKDWDDRFAYS